jgi:hypothetical protein
MNHFDVVAFPVHLTAPNNTLGCSGDGAEIRCGHSEGRIRLDGEPQ